MATNPFDSHVPQHSGEPVRVDQFFANGVPDNLGKLLSVSTNLGISSASLTFTNRIITALMAGAASGAVLFGVLSLIGFAFEKVL